MTIRHRASPATALPYGNAPLLAGLKPRVRAAQVRAVLSVNRELVLLYWQRVFKVLSPTIGFQPGE